MNDHTSNLVSSLTRDQSPHESSPALSMRSEPIRSDSPLVTPAVTAAASTASEASEASAAVPPTANSGNSGFRVNTEMGLKTL